MTYNHLFVYGSLKPGGWAHDLLEGVSDPKPATVPGELYDIGSYPAMRIAHNGARVHGIVYRLPEDKDKLIDSLDRLEGYPFLFDREVFGVTLEDGSQLSALLYFGVNDRLWDKPIIKDGVWNV